jgi:hypothetical protein
VWAAAPKQPVLSALHDQFSFHGTGVDLLALGAVVALDRNQPQPVTSAVAVSPRLRFPDRVRELASPRDPG